MDKKFYSIAMVGLVIGAFIFINPKETVEVNTAFEVYLNDFEFSDLCLAWDTMYGVGVEGLFEIEKAEEIESGLEYVKALAFDGEKLWIGHNRGLSYYDGQAIIDTESITCEVYDLLLYDEELYVASFDGLYIIGDTVDLIDKARGLTDDMVYVLYENSGLIYAGAYRSDAGGISVIKDKAVIKTITRKDGLSHYAITSINQLYDFILVGSGVYTEGGLDLLKENQVVESLDMKDGLAGEKVRHIYVGDYLWICSEYDGISIMTHEFDQVGLITTDEGLSDNECKMIYKDMDGNLWCAMKKGITKISKDKRDELIEDMLRKGE